MQRDHRAPAAPPVPEITVEELIDRYQLLLIDAYGVLVSSSGALPGASEFLARLQSTPGKEYLIVSNDASRSPDTTLARYLRFGLPVERERLLTSGLLLRDHFASAGLVGARCIVLGTDDSADYVRDAGGLVVRPDDDDATVLVVADDDGYPFLETMNDVVSVLLRRLERGHHTHLILPNPDLVFPLRPGAFGITAGAIAALIEAVLQLRDPSGAQRFLPLGKPHLPIFEAVARRFPDLDRRRMVMLGDQLGTDILGANRFGIDSVLVLTGVARQSDLTRTAPRPTYVLGSVG